MVDSLLGSGKQKSAKGPRRSGSSGWGRLNRTIVLGAVVVAFALYWLADSYGADAQELLTYLKASLTFVLAFALVGALAGGTLVALAALARRRGRKPPPRD